MDQRRSRFAEIASMLAQNIVTSPVWLPTNHPDLVETVVEVAVKDLDPGTVISYLSQTVHHMGIILPSVDANGVMVNAMYHNFPGQNVTKWSLDQLPDTQLYQVHFRPRVLREPMAIFEEIANYVENFGSYDPQTNNCEHFVSHVMTGTRTSFSLNNARNGAGAVARVVSSGLSKGGSKH